MEPEGGAAVRHEFGGGFEGVSAACELREKGEADVGGREGVPLIKTASADGGVRGGEAYEERAEAVAGEALDGAVFDVVAGLVERADAAVADVAEPRGVVEQRQHESGVVDGHRREREARGGEGGHERGEDHLREAGARMGARTGSSDVGRKFKNGK